MTRWGDYAKAPVTTTQYINQLVDYAAGRNMTFHHDWGNAWIGDDGRTYVGSSNPDDFNERSNGGFGGGGTRGFRIDAGPLEGGIPIGNLFKDVQQQKNRQSLTFEDGLRNVLAKSAIGTEIDSDDLIEKFGVPKSAAGLINV